MSPIRLFVLSLAVSPALAATPPDDPGHVNKFRAIKSPSSDVVSFEVTTSLAKNEWARADIRVTNSTGDQLVMLRKDQPSFDLPGKGKLGVKIPLVSGLLGKTLFIEPNQTKTHSFQTEGDNGYHVDKMTIHPSGFYAGSNVGKAVKAPDFQLPASVNDFTAGPFACKLANVKQETKQTHAAFACTYNGKGLGIIESKRIGVREPGGKEFANAKHGAGRDLVLPGETSKFTAVFEIPAKVVDMQFATLNVLWRDALSESTMQPLALSDFEFYLDPEATVKENE